MKKRFLARLLLLYILSAFFLTPVVYADDAERPEPQETVAAEEVNDERSNLEEIPSDAASYSSDENDSLAAEGTPSSDPAPDPVPPEEPGAATTPEPLNDSNENPAPDKASVYNWEELSAWLAENNGGTVTLGDHIEITDYCEIYCENQLTIETGDYGFVVKAELAVYSAVTFLGSGSVNPVVEVLGGGYLFINSSDSTPVIICATGENGCALQLDADSNYAASSFSRPLFCAEGDGSAALRSDIALDLSYHDIKADGIGAKSIVSSQPVKFYLSSIISEGDAITAPEIALDTCLVSPAAANAQVISRKIAKLKLDGIRPEFSIGEAKGLFDRGMRCTATLSADGMEDANETIYIQFDDAGIDFDLPGKYSLPGKILPPFKSYDLISDSYPVKADIFIYDTKIPTLFDAYKDGNTYLLKFSYEAENLEPLVLWRSDDEGESWSVYWEDDPSNWKSTVTWDGYCLELRLPLAELKNPALLVFEVKDLGGSQVIYLDSSKEQTAEDMGGDRDGGDRVTMPWDVIAGGLGSSTPVPTPTPKPPADNSEDGKGVIYTFPSTNTMASENNNQAPERPKNAESLPNPALESEKAAANPQDSTQTQESAVAVSATGKQITAAPFRMTSKPTASILDSFGGIGSNLFGITADAKTSKGAQPLAGMLDELSSTDAAQGLADDHQSEQQPAVPIPDQINKFPVILAAALTLICIAGLFIGLFRKRRVE